GEEPRPRSGGHVQTHLSARNKPPDTPAPKTAWLMNRPKQQTLPRISARRSGRGPPKAHTQLARRKDPDASPPCSNPCPPPASPGKCTRPRGGQSDWACWG